MSIYFPPKQITNGASSSLLSNIFYKDIFLNKVFTVNLYGERNYISIQEISKNNSYNLLKNGAFNRILTPSVNYYILAGNIKILKK